MDHNTNKDLVNLFLTELMENKNFDNVDDIIHPDYRPSDIEGKMLHICECISIQNLLTTIVRQQKKQVYCVIQNPIPET